MVKNPDSHHAGVFIPHLSLIYERMTSNMLKMRKQIRVIMTITLSLAMMVALTGCNQKVNESVKTNSNVFYVSNNIEGKGGGSYSSSVKLGSLIARNNPVVEMSFAANSNVSEVIVYKEKPTMTNDFLAKAKHENITSNKKVNINFGNLADWSVLNDTSGKIYVRVKFTSSAGGGTGWYHVEFMKETTQPSVSNPFGGQPSVNSNGKEVSPSQGSSSVTIAAPKPGMPTIGYWEIASKVIPSQYRASYTAKTTYGTGKVTLSANGIDLSSVLVDVRYKADNGGITTLQTISAQCSGGFLPGVITPKTTITAMRETSSGLWFKVTAIGMMGKDAGIYVLTMDVNVNSKYVVISNVQSPLENSDKAAAVPYAR